MAKRELTGASKQLYQQAEKWAKLSNLGSIRTRDSHKEKMSTFVRFIGSEFGLQNLKNLSDKHLVAYIEWAKAEGYASSTIQNTLSAVRFIHRQLPKTRYYLSENSVINVLLQQEAANRGETPKAHEIPQRQYLHTGRNVAWSDAEYSQGIKLAEKMGRRDVQLAIRMSRYLGLRISEVTKSERNQLIWALNDGYLTVKGKGGLIRDIPLDTKEAYECIRDALKQTRVDKQKVFVEKLGNTHKTIRSIESWIYRHRSEFAGTPERELTMHGLRHRYAQDHYAKFLRQTDGNEKAARALTAQLLGHGRDWVTKIYLD